MASETENTPKNWTHEQLQVAQQLLSNGNAALRTGQLQLAHQILQETSAILDMVEDQEQVAQLELRAQLSNELGFFYQQTDDIDNALQYHQSAVDLGQKLIDAGVAFRPNATATLINLAGVLMRKQEPDQALQRITQGTDLIKSYLDENPEELDAAHLGFGAFHTRALIELALDKTEEADQSAETALYYAELTFDDELTRTLQAANGFEQLAVQFFQKEDTEHAIKWGKKAEEIARIAFDIEKEPAIPVFVQIQLFMILFHETAGNYDAAEDALYNAIDVLGNHPQLLERGRMFYDQCRKQTDKRLEEGGLPREEVEEGVKEIESRIEAFGGHEKLAQALKQIEEQQ